MIENGDCVNKHADIGQIVSSSVRRRGEHRQHATTHHATQRRRRFQIVVYGATGFTGALVAAYLAQKVANGLKLRWAIAGRSAKKLLNVKGVPLSVPRLIADSADLPSLVAMAAQTKVILSTVGPYTLYGSNLVEACIQSGTHYCDITGEVMWVREMIQRHNDAAVQAGCKIVFCCGYDCIPSDMTTYLASSQLPSGSPTSIKLLATVVNGAPSGGTLASGKLIQRAFKHEHESQLAFDPYLLAPDVVGSPFAEKDSQTLRFPSHMLRKDQPGSENGQVGMRFDWDWGTLTLPFFMSAINCRVVRRSLCLRGHATTYDEAMSIGAAVRMGMYAIRHLPSFVKAMSFKPGEGPNDNIQRTGSFETCVLAENDHGERVKVRMKGQGDPGYAATSVMLAESGLCLALDGDTDVAFERQIPHRFGCLTPSTAIGMQLIHRLEATGIFRFERVELGVKSSKL